jgi:hypothetical protein
MISRLHLLTVFLMPRPALLSSDARKGIIRAVEHDTQKIRSFGGTSSAVDNYRQHGELGRLALYLHATLQGWFSKEMVAPGCASQNPRE